MLPVRGPRGEIALIVVGEGGRLLTNEVVFAELDNLDSVCAGLWLLHGPDMRARHAPGGEPLGSAT